MEEAKLPSPGTQRPHVPVLVGGGGERTLRLVAEYADASNLVPADWGGAASSPDDVRRKYALLHEHCAAVGRPFDSILRSFEFVPVVLADTPAALEAKLAQRTRIGDAGLVRATRHASAQRYTPERLTLIPRGRPPKRYTRHTGSYRSQRACR